MTTNEPFFTAKMKWTRNRWGAYFATAENSSYQIEVEDLGRSEGGKHWTVIRNTTYTGPESLPTRRVIKAAKTLKKAQELAEIDRYNLNENFKSSP